MVIEIIKTIAKSWPVATMVFVTITANVFVAWYVKSEDMVYYWDLSGYWSAAISLRDSLHMSLGGGLQDVVSSFNSNYNLLPIIPISIVMELFGDSRYVYVASIFNLYLVPAALISADLTSKVLARNDEDHKGAIFLISYSTALFIPATYLPVLRGLPDVLGLLIFAGTIRLGVRLRVWKRIKIWYCMILGLLIGGLLLTRRWYAFLTLGSITVSVVAMAYSLFLTATDRLPIRRVENIFRNISFNVLMIILTVLLVIGSISPYLLVSYTYNYSDVYSAYRNGGFTTQLGLLRDYFGLLVLLFAGLGYALSFSKLKENRVQMFTSLAFLTLAVVIFMLFTRIQDFEYHHYYLLLPTILWGMTMLFAWLLKTMRYELLAMAFTAMFLVIVNAFIHPLGPPGSGGFNWLLGTSSPPSVRNDMKELRRIAEWARTTDASIYVLSSSATLNYTTLQNIYLPETSITNVLISSDVDKRDGFPKHFLQAEYLLVGVPAQTHLKSGQLTVTSIVENITRQSPENLQEIKRYQLSDGVEAILYKRVAPYDDIFIDSVRKDFELAYPNYPDLVNI